MSDGQKAPAPPAPQAQPPSWGFFRPRALSHIGKGIGAEVARNAFELPGERAVPQVRQASNEGRD